MASPGNRATHAALAKTRGMFALPGTLDCGGDSLRPSNPQALTSDTAHGHHSLQNNRNSSEEKYKQMPNKITQGNTPEAAEDEHRLISDLVLTK